MRVLRIALLGGCFALLAAAPARADEIKIDGLPYFRYVDPVAAPEPVLASLAAACLAGVVLLRRRRLIRYAGASPSARSAAASPDRTQSAMPTPR